MNSQKITFRNAAGHMLGARLDLPVDGAPVAFALFAHCFTCTKNLRAVTHISRALARERIAVLRFDFTGLGESEGDFADTNFSSNVEDLVAAAEFLERQYRAPEILIGHSLGGAAVLQAAHRIPAAKAVATIGAPCEPSHVEHLLASAREEITQRGEAEVLLAGRRFTIKRQFLDDLEQTRMQQSIRTLRRALLIFHSPLDAIVGIENAARIFQAARHPKSFISLDRADHLLSEERDSQYVGTVVAAWAQKYVSTPAAQQPGAVEPTEQRVVVRTGREHYRTEILAGRHSLVADEPASVGGTDTGATPYDLLVAGLGACTSITLRMYADHKQWPLEEIVVRLQHAKIHAADCDACETRTGKLDNIKREIELIGPLSEEQKARLIEIADRCPVHRTLHSEVVVTTKMT